MQTVVVRPRNEEELQLVTQLLKRMKINAQVVDENTHKRRAKQRVLSDLEKSVEAVNRHTKGTFSLKSADQLLNEL